MPEDFPRLGLGTYTEEDKPGRREATRRALEVGYRHVDTAQSYDTEEHVGRGIRDGDVDREEVFLATKVATANLAYGDVLSSTEESLDRLGVEYLDLLYVHWPTHTYDPEGTLAAFDELYEAGKIEHVGLSNFTPGLLDEARRILDAPIFAHQVECHPLLPQEELREYAREHDHWLVAYSPLGQGRVLDVPELVEVAEKHDASTAQVSLAWLLSKENVAAIPKASGEHVRDNWEAREIDLDPEDVERIDAIDRRERVIDPGWAPWNRE